MDAVMNDLVFEFDESVPSDEIEDALEVAACTMESLHGRPAVLIDGTPRFDPERRQCLIDGATEIGRATARVLAGFLERSFGAGSFRVRRTPAPIQREGAGAA